LNTQWLSNAVAVVIAAVLFFALSFPVENTYVDKGVYASLGTDCLFDAIRSHSMATSLVVQEVGENQKQKTSPVVPVAVKVEKVAPIAKAEVQKVETPEKETIKKEIVKKETPKVAEAPKVKVTPEPAKVKVAEPKKETPKAVAKKKNYHIIVASLTTLSDANRMLEQYKKQGYSDAVVKENSGRYRISLCNYADKAAAYQKLNDLKKADAFKGAWMLTSK
jgi:cell division septation protein DedD